MPELIVLIIASVVSCVQCDNLWGKTFYIYKDSRTWNEARKICQDNGRRLAQIDNKQTMDALLAYANTAHWTNNMQGHFWIGLNRADNAPYHRWDHCESTDSSSFTFWAEEPATDKKCVFAENDILRWKNEVCDSSSYQYLCQEDTGPCTYTVFSGTCTGPSHSEASVVPGEDVAECEDLCSNTLQDELACWMYSYDNPDCTLYFDTDPWACTKPSLAATAKTRVCFTFDAVTSSSSYSNSNTKPIINCDSYTTQPATTSTPTTTTSSTTTATTTTTTGVATSINTIAPAVITTSTSNIFEVNTSSENTTSISTNNVTATAEPTATSNSDTATADTTETTPSPTTPATANITMTANPTTPTATNITMATTPTTQATANITMTANPTTPTTTNITTATTPTTPATTNITMTANPTTPTTTNITMATTPTTPATANITMTMNPTTPTTTNITMATTPTTQATANITMTMNPTTPTTTNITMATTPATESMTTTTTPTTTATGSITMATNPNIPTTASITMATTTTNPANNPAGPSPVTAVQASTPTATDSSGNNETCPCLVCVATKNRTQIQGIVDAILLLLKLDKSKLSATRRKLESEPDGRPSAQAIGYSGMTFIVITISFFLLSDLIRLCQFFQDKKSNPQSQIRNNTA